MPDKYRAQKIIVRSLLCHAHMPIAMRCFGSFHRAYSQTHRIVVHDDGSLTNDDKLKLADEIEASIISREEADASLSTALESFPFCRAFRERNPLALKLFDVVVFEENEYVNFVDSDVYFFARAENLFPNHSLQAVFMDNHFSAYSIPWRRANALNRLKLSSRINTGLFSFPVRLFNFELIEDTLSRGIVCKGWAGHIEQTLWAALACRVESFLYDSRQITVVQSGTQWTEFMVAAHFVGTHRARLKEIHNDELPDGVVPLRLLPSGQLSMFEFLKERALAKIKRRNYT